MNAGDDAPLPKLPPRVAEGHKGSFGSVLVVGGCAHPPRMMLGGAMLAARAALRAGAGRVIAAVPAPLAGEALVMLPEATVVALPCDAAGELQPSACAELLDAAMREAAAVVVGPAIGRGEAAGTIVMRLVALGERPTVVDADAIHLFAAHRDAPHDLRGTVVFTPHPGEARALGEAFGAPADDAAALARRLGAVVVLKGAVTEVSDGIRVWRRGQPNPALATGGSGDVLAGATGSFLAQFSRTLSPGEIAALAVEAHARAGGLWRGAHGDAGALAREIADLLPDAMHAMRGA